MIGLTLLSVSFSCFFFFNVTTTTEIYTLSLHDALPILLMRSVSIPASMLMAASGNRTVTLWKYSKTAATMGIRSEEHTSELQSLRHLVCRLLLEKKKERNCA